MRQTVKKKCRFHLRDSNFSIEGVLAARTKTEYVVWAPKVITSKDAPEVGELEGHVEIPRDNVLFYQVIA